MEGKLKTIELKGKSYVQVAERIRYFRENYKDGRIETSYQILDNRVIFTAKIYDGDKLVSTGTGMKNTAQEFELEKAETRAIGRALGIAGIGIDCGVATYDEVQDYYRSAQDDKASDKQLDVIRRYSDQTFIIEFMKKEFNVTSLPALTKEQASHIITTIKGGEK
jgi:hypothetical protein